MKVANQIAYNLDIFFKRMFYSPFSGMNFREKVKSLGQLKVMAVQSSKMLQINPLVTDEHKIKIALLKK